MNTLSTIINKNYENKELSEEKFVNQLKEEFLNKDEGGLKKANELLLDYQLNVKSRLRRELHEDLKKFNTEAKPKPRTFYDLEKNTKQAIKRYRKTGDRSELDLLSTTLENVKDIERSRYLLNDNLETNTKATWINGILGAVIGAGASYLLADGSDTLTTPLVLIGTFGGAGLSALTTTLLSTISEYKVGRTLQEANILDTKLTNLKIKNKLNNSYK